MKVKVQSKLYTSRKNRFKKRKQAKAVIEKIIVNCTEIVQDVLNIVNIFI